MEEYGMEACRTSSASLQEEQKLVLHEETVKEYGEKCLHPPNITPVGGVPNLKVIN